jgi:large repetitive protein
VVRQPPVAAKDHTSGFEDIQLNGNVSVNDSDPNGQALTYTLLDEMGTPSLGSLVFNPDGSFTLNPLPNAFGAATFLYQARDTDAMCDTALVFLDLLPVNDAPVAVNDTAATMEETLMTGSIGNNDSDVDHNNTELEWQLLDGGTAGANGTIVVDVEGTFSYTPNDNAPDTVWFSYVVCDPEPTCDTATVVIIITPVNDTPLAVNDTINVLEEITLYATVATNDSDAESTSAQLLWNLVDDGTAGDNGSLVLNADGSYSYAPALDFFGTVQFTYRVCDPENACDTATVVVHVLNVNDPPVITENTLPVDTIYVTTAHDAALLICLTALDADMEPLDASILDLAPANGTVTGLGNGDTCITYQPNSGYVGQDTLAVSVCDAAAECDRVVVVISIAPEPNEPPVAIDDVASTDREEPVEIDVLANDTDPDGDALVIASATASNGNVVVGTTLVYTPDSGFCGVDTIIYSVCDPGSLCDTAVVIVTAVCPQEPGEPENDLRIPEGFSPNGDEVGDIWRIEGLELYPEASVSLFNRWGAEVFHADPYQNDWDGRSTAQFTWQGSLPSGTYFYVLDLKNGEAQLRGFVYLTK